MMFWDYDNIQTPWKCFFRQWNRHFWADLHKTWHLSQEKHKQNFLDFLKFGRFIDENQSSETIHRNSLSAIRSVFFYVLDILTFDKAQKIF